METSVIPLSELSLKSLRMVEIVAEEGNVTRAAQRLNRSQTAISKAILGLEQKLGKALFTRSGVGMVLTPEGEILTSRIKESMLQFSLAADAYQHMVRDDVVTDTNPIFSMNVSYSRLKALIDVYQAQSVKEASRLSGVSVAALYNSVHYLESVLDTVLFEKSPQGNQATPFCVELTRHVRLAFRVLQDAIKEIMAASENLSGDIKIAAFPSVRNYVIPQGCIEMKRQHPDVRIFLKGGMHRDMVWQLRSGEIDLLVSALFPTVEDPKDVEHRVLFQAPLVLVARRGHPWFINPSFDGKSLERQHWVLPPTNSSAREYMEILLRKHGVKSLQCFLEAYSYSMLKEILLNSDCVGIMFAHSAATDIDQGLLQSVPFEPEETLSIGIKLRKYTTPSLQTRRLIEIIENFVKDNKRFANSSLE